MEGLPTIQEQQEPSKTSLALTEPSATPTDQQHVADALDRNATSPVPKPQRDSLPKTIVTHAQARGVTLSEDCFGLLRTNDKRSIRVQRFTWKTDDVQVQIITYGARIFSMKSPDESGISTDIVLGFSDIAGYLRYDEHFFGATIGAVTGKVEDVSFELDSKKFKFSESESGNYANGGWYGLNKVVWNAYVKGTKVVLSYAIPHGHEGLPGPVIINIAYELTSKNEFCIDMEAKSGRPTVINLSNLCYFNLGGHHSGPEELKKHSVTINANCYTLTDESDFPTGKIMSVANTKFDFSRPKLLRDCLDVEPDDGFDQNFCVNRGVSQKLCLVARVVHATNGRVVEILSNQYGVRFETANRFGLGTLSPSSQDNISVASGEGGVFFLLNEVYKLMNASGTCDASNIEEIHKLLVKIRKMSVSRARVVDYPVTTSFVTPDFCMYGFVEALQKAVIPVQKMIPNDIEDIEAWSELKLIAERMLEKYKQMDSVTTEDTETDWPFPTIEQLPTDKLEEVPIVTRITSEVGNLQLKPSLSTTKKYGSTTGVDPPVKKVTSFAERSSSINVEILSKEFTDRPSGDRIEPSQVSGGGSSKQNSTQSGDKSAKSSTTNGSYVFDTRNGVKQVESAANVIPDFYKDGRIHGKNNAIYKRHGAMAFQTQNYPDAIHHSNFPSPVLNPGDTYRHTIVYKFWVRNGSLHFLRNKRKCP